MLSDFGVVGGGYGNTIATRTEAATIAGGVHNTITTNSYYAIIAGGIGNNIGASSAAGTIGGGSGNTIAAGSPFATIAGGINNQVGSNSPSATIPGGRHNSATDYAFAAGHRAKANHTGAFVWADSTDADFASTGKNQFLIRATGGVGIGTGSPAAALEVMAPTNTAADNTARFRAPAIGPNLSHVHFGMFGDWYIRSAHSDGKVVLQDSGGNVGIGTGSPATRLHIAGDTTVNGAVNFGSSTRQMLNLYNVEYGIGVQAYGLYFRTDSSGPGGNFYWFKGGTHNDATGNSGGGNTMMSLTASGLTVNGTFVSASDRNVKENFQPVDSQAVLEKVAALPLSQWNYKTDTGSRHLGPMAQDFYAAFGVGPDDKHIATVDADGVALAAIQGLNLKLEQKLEQKETEITELKQQLAELKTLVGKLANERK